jgi:hypothetical protein
MDAPSWSARSCLAWCASISGKIGKAVREVEGFNAKLALAITRSVGTWRAPQSVPRRSVGV